MRAHLILISVLQILLVIPFGDVNAVQPNFSKEIDAQITQRVNAEIAKTEKELEKDLQQYCASTIASMVDKKYQRTEDRYLKQTDNHFMVMHQSFNDTMTSFKWLVSVAGMLITALVGLAIFLFLRKDKSIKDQFERMLANTQNELQRKIKEFERMKTDYDDVLLENKQLKDRFQSLTAYKNKKIVWAYETKDIEAKLEIEDIRQDGFSVQVCPPGEEKHLKTSSCDVLIYYYRNSANAKQRLNAIGDFLETLGRDAPLLIYTYKSGARFIPDDQLEGLKGYRNYILANMPLTLKSHFNSLVRM